MPTKLTNEQKARSIAVIQWLLAHPLINKSGLCDFIGYDRTGFQRALDGDRYVSRNFITRMEEVLKDYGYTPPVTDQQ